MAIKKKRPRIKRVIKPKDENEFIEDLPDYEQLRRLENPCGYIDDNEEEYGYEIKKPNNIK